MSKEFHPLVSIVIPVYNGANYMSEAIDSALAQTYPNIEILVINDGSTDDGATHDIAMSYGEKIRYFQKENGGVVSALNFGIENMRGEYFAWLSHDDLYLPEKIEKQVLALKEHKGPRPAFCICNCSFINENGEYMYQSYVNKDCAFDNPRCFLFLGFVGFNGIMVLIPKMLFDICGCFKPSLATHEYDMWIRIMDVADVLVEPDCLSCMRIHSCQVSNQRKLDASIEIDSFMSKGTQDIPFSEFEAFIIDQIDKKGIEYIYGILVGYMWFQHLPSTSVQILKKLQLMCENPGVEIDELYSSLLGHSDIGGIKACFEHRLHNDKPLVVIYCENFTDDVFKEMSTGLALLSLQFKIVIFYHTIEEYNLQLLGDANITAIKIMNHVDYKMPLRLSLLSYLLNVKLFWYYSADNMMRYSNTFHFLRIMEICSIASFHDINKVTVYETDIDNTKYDQHKHLPKASLITSVITPSMPGILSFQNIITVPDNSLKALVRWKMIFDVLLARNESCELKSRINNNLSTILEKTNTSSSDYINNYIRNFLIEVDRKSLALLNSYEQRNFWKLTKPLRSCVWFFRKANKAIYLIINRKKTIRDIIYQIRMIIKNRRIQV